MFLFGPFRSAILGKRCFYIFEKLIFSKHIVLAPRAGFLRINRRASTFPCPSRRGRLAQLVSRWIRDRVALRSIPFALLLLLVPASGSAIVESPSARYAVHKLANTVISPGDGHQQGWVSGLFRVQETDSRTALVGTGELHLASHYCFSFPRAFHLIQYFLLTIIALSLHALLWYRTFALLFTCFHIFSSAFFDKQALAMREELVGIRHSR